MINKNIEIAQTTQIISNYTILKLQKTRVFYEKCRKGEIKQPIAGLLYKIIYQKLTLTDLVLF